MNPAGSSFFKDALGVGTGAPLYQLHVLGQTYVEKSGAKAMFLNRTGTTGQILGVQYAGTDIGYLSVDASDFMLKGVSGIGLKLQTNGNNDALAIDTNQNIDIPNGDLVVSTGNVGIGTTSPSKQLHVFSPTIDQVALFESGDSHGGIELRDNTTTAGHVVLRALGNALSLNAGGSTRMRINSSGNVGIGTTTPISGYDLTLNSGTLHLGTVGTQEIKFGGGGTLDFKDGSNNVMFSINDQGTSSDFYLNGDVAIGIANPVTGYKLAVDGKIITEEVNVQASGAWPDYVFSKNYNLKTLEETEDYIKEEGHLPNIPSASEVAENGIHVGEMNTKLLEKIEELTLHLIDQNKKMEQIQKENSDFRERLEALESK